jgi:hypothetical protein
MPATPTSTRSSEPSVRPTTAIWIAAGIYFVVVAFVPLGSLLLYPLHLFSTWVHEMGHGLTALVLGGEFHHLEITRNGAGVAYSSGVASGLPRALIGFGGMLAPPLVGATLIAAVHGPRRARIVLLVLAGAIVLSLVLWVRSITGYIAMPIVAAALAWAAVRGFSENPHRRVIAVQFLSVVLGLDTITRMVGYALSSTASKGHTSDTGRIAQELGGPHVLWGLLIIVIGVGSMWLAWRFAARRSTVRAPRA